MLCDGDGEQALTAVAPHLIQPARAGRRRPAHRRRRCRRWPGRWRRSFLVGIPIAAEPIAQCDAGALPRRRSPTSPGRRSTAFTAHCDDSDEAAQILNDIAYRMMAASNVPERDDIWITIVDAPFPNAFALPDNSIIVTDDLIQLARSPDELTGVIAHEIAHVERNHVMKNVIRQIGAGIFFDIVFGGAGAGQAIAVASVNLAGLRYTRDDEERSGRARPRLSRRGRHRSRRPRPHVRAFPGQPKAKRAKSRRFCPPILQRLLAPPPRDHVHAQVLSLR